MRSSVRNLKATGHFEIGGSLKNLIRCKKFGPVEKFGSVKNWGDPRELFRGVVYIKKTFERAISSSKNHFYYLVRTEIKKEHQMNNKS